MIKVFIRIFLFIILISIGLTAPVIGIEISGDVWGTWEPSNNPYDVISEVRVPPGSTLTIQEGCQIIFQGHYKFIIDTSAVFIAIGSESDSILFTAEDPEEGWHGLRFYYANGQSQLSYCIIEYGDAYGYGFEEFGGAVFLYNTPITIHHCLIRYNQARSGGGIYCYNSEADIQYNEIYSNIAFVYGGGL